MTGLPGFRLLAVIVVGQLFSPLSLLAQPKGYNYDEAKVPDYSLPDPLVREDGTRVTTAEQWYEQRRPEILRLFETHVYGRSPEAPGQVHTEVRTSRKDALDGLAHRREVAVSLTGKADGPTMDVLIYLPANAEGPVPVFLGLNFHGNHSITAEKDVRLSPKWMRNDTKRGNIDHRATEQTRGRSSSRWPLKMILDRGYGVATIYCGDIDPDYHDRFRNGIHPHYLKAGQTEPAADEWGTIAAWAWGLSRAMDYFETDPAIDHQRVAVIGHSRLGKTSLWVGASDARFSLVISNDSGCGGAALSRRAFGETVKRINTSFPHWFCGNFKKYNDNEAALPVDQHQLIALIAPRPAYVASAEDDLWADPRGEFLSALHADPVYELLGKPGLPVKSPPAVNEPVMGTIGYHIRSGKHDVTDYDWAQYLKFADMHLRGKSSQ